MDKSIIKIAVLSEFWENQKKDIVDLLVPFVRIALEGNYYGKHKIVDFTNTHKNLKERVSTNFTGLLLDKILKRMVYIGDLQKKDDTYCVHNENVIKEALVKEATARSEVDRSWNELLEDLKQYIRRNDIMSYFRMERIEINLWDALTNRLDIDNDAQNICDHIAVGAYILEKSKLRDKYYDIMNQISCSIFISNSIDAFSITKSEKFDYENFYFDTRFVMSVVGLNNEFDNKNASELMREIINCNGKMYIFKHNYEEIVNVIDQYIKQKFHNGYAYSPIEYFESNHFDETRCDIFRSSLKDKILEKNIHIVEDAELDDDFSNKYGKEFNELYYINRDARRDFDKQNYLQMLNINKDNKSLFISTSNSLYKLFKDANHEGLLFVSDTSLASLLFVNFNSNCNNIQFNSVLSKSWLIQNPDAQTASSIFERIKSYATEGKIDNKVLYCFQTNRIALRELYLESLKSDEPLSAQDIENIFEKYVEQRVKQQKQIIIDEKNKEVDEYISKYNQANEEKTNAFAENSRLRNITESLSESLQIVNEKYANSEKKNSELQNQHVSDEIFIANTKTHYKVISDRIAIFTIALIVAFLLYAYLKYIWNIVVPEFHNNFKQSPMFTVIGVIPLLGLGFINKIIHYLKSIKEKLSNCIFNYFISKLSKKHGVKE